MQIPSQPHRNSQAQKGMALCAAAALLLAPPRAHGMSEVGQVARKGQPVPKSFVVRQGWPQGALDMVNDPARENGWGLYGWGLVSGTEAHLCHFGMNVQTPQDVDRLIQKLAQVKARPLRLALSPTHEGTSIGFVRTMRGGKDIGAVFSIGSQKVLDEWFQRMSKSESGKRILGRGGYTKRPTAQPPTLTLYVANDAVDLGALLVPAGIDVSALMPKKSRAKHPDDPLVREIKAFIENHKALQREAKKRTTEGE